MGKLYELNADKIGSIQYEEKDRYRIPSGLYGFDQEKEFVLVHSENVHPFCWLQCETNPALSFLLLDPLLTYPDFTLTMSREDLKDIQLEEGDENKIYVIATVPDDHTKITLNFQGPLVFNTTKRLIQQVIAEGQPLQAPLLKPS